MSTEGRYFFQDELLVSPAEASHSVARAYNAFGSLTQSDWSDGQTWRTTYDDRGLVDTVEWDDAGLFKKVADYQRHVTGAPITVTSDYASDRTFVYDVLGRVRGDEIKGIGNSVQSSRTYTYYDADNLNSITGQSGGLAVTGQFIYDSFHRLKSATGPGGYAAAFTYSPSGNIVTADVVGAGDAPSRNVTYAYGAMDPQAVDRLSDDLDVTYAQMQYDRAGNVVQREIPGKSELTSYLWGAGDRLREADDGTANKEVYFYDANKARTVVVNATDGARFWFAEREFHYDLNGVETEAYLHLSNGATTVARVNRQQQIELQHHDALQNLILSLNDVGDVVAAFSYSPFGEVIEKIGETTHRRQFNGKEHDKRTGLRYYGFRNYDAVLLRWNSGDPLLRFSPEADFSNPQQQNLYQFSLNNPLRYYDPDGRKSWLSNFGSDLLRTARDNVEVGVDLITLGRLTDLAHTLGQSGPGPLEMAAQGLIDGIHGNAMAVAGETNFSPGHFTMESPDLLSAAIRGLSKQAADAYLSGADCVETGHCAAEVITVLSVVVGWGNKYSRKKSGRSTTSTAPILEVGNHMLEERNNPNRLSEENAMVGIAPTRK